jgi:hemerythrin-like domain-containing protein
LGPGIFPQKQEPGDLDATIEPALYQEVTISKMNQPNIAADTIRIHSIITRALQVTTERSQAFVQEGYPDATTREGFISYAQSLASLLHAHHLTEDELVFPYLREKLPEAPYDVLTAQHREMVPILDEIKADIEAIAADILPGQSLNDLNRALNKVADIWYPHIQLEEEHFSVEELAALIDTEEHIRLGQMFAQHGMEHAGPNYLIVPFMLYNLSAENRAILSQAMPPNVTQQLVPIEWKEKWAPMLPFLLD